MGKVNRASGNDRVDAQVSQTGGKGDKPQKDERGTTTNIVSGNAKVGRQLDEVHSMKITFKR